MGGIHSKSIRLRRYSSSSYGPSPAWDSSSYGPSPAVPSETYAQPAQPATKQKLQRRYSRIADNYNSLDDVTAALAQAGLESSNLIVGIDFTKSNEWTGARSFNRRSLHHIGDTPNPYEQAISIIGRTLSVFDEDNLIPCFGFGDALTHDQSVFSFYPDDRLCNGFEEALRRYREIVPHLRMAGPTSFAPIIEAAIRIVEQSGGQYHVLLIIADGQVTRSVDTDNGKLSTQEQNTVNAIVEASEYPLSIVLVGVGDGPWDMMRQFDDNIPARAFDNFQFVNFTDIMSKNVAQSRKDTEFALASLMEIPSQYKATLDLQILGTECKELIHICKVPSNSVPTLLGMCLSFGHPRKYTECRGPTGKGKVSTAAMEYYSLKSLLIKGRGKYNCSVENSKTWNATSSQCSPYIETWKDIPPAARRRSFFIGPQFFD